MAVDMSQTNQMTSVLARFRNPHETGFEYAWVGMEPTFQTLKSVRKWKTMAAQPGGEDAYFEDAYMLKWQRNVAKAIRKKYVSDRKAGRPCCMFERVELDDDLDQWHVKRQNLIFHWEDDELEPFEVKLSIDPETFEYSIKPVPLAWFYDENFVAFLERYVWNVPLKLGMSTALAHGGGQFSLSAKTFMTGSLLADDIAYKVNHPELSTWMMDWPECDDRAFRATGKRFAAFREVLDQYWEGRFHPQAIGILTAENAYLDRGFGPAHTAHKELMDSSRGPVGDARDVFQTNFAFGRTVRLNAQNIHPGYWQSAHPDEDGYRPDQIMRYSEGNLNRLQIAGELHVKSGKVLDKEKVPELETPLDIGLLTTEASWENRAQTSRTSAWDFVEALLLDVHHSRYLQSHPHVSIKPSLLQDQLLGDAEQTLERHGGAETLARLRREARQTNLEDSRGRINSDWVEPEALFWAAWHALPAGEKTAIAREAINGFREYVEEASAVDPRPGAKEDPFEAHRHRVHPLLWQALIDSPDGNSDDPVNVELNAWQAKKKKYLSRRAPWSQLSEAVAPWDATP